MPASTHKSYTSHLSRDRPGAFGSLAGLYATGITAGRLRCSCMLTWEVLQGSCLHHELSVALAISCIQHPHLLASLLSLGQACQRPDTTPGSTPSPAKSCSDIQALTTYNCLGHPPLILLGISFLLPWVVRTIGQTALGAGQVENWQPGPRRRPGVSRKQLPLLLLPLRRPTRRPG